MSLRPASAASPFSRRPPCPGRTVFATATALFVITPPIHATSSAPAALPVPPVAVLLFAALLILTAVGFIWVLALRRRVLRQVGEIRAQVDRQTALETSARVIVDHAADFIFTTTLDGAITSFNPAGERLLGLDRTQALKLNFRDLFADTDEGARALATLRFADQPGPRPMRLRARDGGVLWVEIHARVLIAHDQPCGLLAIARDITDRKRLDDQRDAALAAAEAGTRAKSQFLAAMSHEIRTPMNGVIGMTNILLGTPLSSEQNEVAETIRTSTESLLTVLDDIGDISRIEAGKLELENHSFEVADTVHDTLDLLLARAATKKLELSSYLAAEVPSHLRGDAGRLRQILLNLVGNAIKFTERGEILVSVSRKSHDATHTTLLFEVTDSGIGITPEIQARLFAPFTQADSSISRRFGGTGLGLAICKQLSGLMGGAIGVRSAAGSGSTFWFTVRLENAATPPAPMPAAAPSFTVLCATPSTTQQRVIELYLLQQKIPCTIAPDLFSAVAIARTAAQAGKPFDVILIDYTLCDPGADDPLGSLRVAASHVHARLVAMTTIDRRIAGDQRFFAEADATISKPVRQRELIETLLRITAPDAGLAQAVATTRGPATSRPGAGRFDGLRALVVEDNLVNQRVAKLMLARLGFRIDLAGDGLEALDVLERAPYDLVFMDCQMPGIDGFETTRRIRASGRHPGLRIIALTANAMEGDRDRCLAAGMDDYVSKPIRADDVFAALDRCGAGDVTPQL